MSRLPPDPFKAAEKLGLVAARAPIYLDAALNWADKALPGLLRTDYGRYFPTYLGDRSIPLPFATDAFESPVAGALLASPRGSSGDPSKRSFPPMDSRFRGDMVDAHLSVTHVAHGRDMVTLRPRIAPAHCLYQLVVLWLDECYDVPFQQSVNHWRVEPSIVAPYGIPGCHGKRAWVFARRDSIHPNWLKRQYQRDGVPLAQTKRFECLGSPPFAERARPEPLGAQGCAKCGRVPLTKRKNPLG